MIWFVATAAAAVLVYALIRTMRQYEQESAAAALEQVTELMELTMDLQRRIENLEAIVTSVESEGTDSEPGLDNNPPVSGRTKIRS